MLNIETNAGREAGDKWSHTKLCNILTQAKQTH